MRDDRSKRVRWYPVGVIVLLSAVLAAGTVSNLQRNPQPQLVADGIPGRAVAVAGGATLRGGDGPRLELVQQAIADLDALTLPGGATLAGWDGPWRYVWPRDASFVAAARCSLGQHDEAFEVLDFLNRIRPSTGRWRARYTPEGTNPTDGREDQSDGSGWVLWATWFCTTGAPHAEADDPGAAWDVLGADEDDSSTGPHEPLAGLDGLPGELDGRVDGRLAEYWPMVRESGDQIVAELGPDGLPAPSPDYWERPESEVTLGTVAPLLAGLRSGLAIAETLDRVAEVPTWQDALDKLSAATDRVFGPTYPRTPAKAAGTLGDPAMLTGAIGIGGGADAIVTVLGPPFAPERAVVSKVIEHTHKVLTQPNGGVTPGEQWRADGVAWTPQTALFALSAAARGDRSTAEKLLTWLDTNRTPSGALPEKVNRDLQPAGEAPLGWTSALVVLTTAALNHPLPIP